MSPSLTAVLASGLLHGFHDYVEFTLQKGTSLVRLLVQHAALTAESIVIAVPLAVTLGVVSTYDDRLATAVLWLAGIGMTIPSLALFGLLVPILGIGDPPVIVALVVYAQLPVVRNTYLGLIRVDEATIEAGTGLGMTRRQRLRRVQLPQALPVILSGLRNAVVLVIGVAIVGAFVGAGGLGKFIFRGIRTGATDMIVVTTIIVVLLALSVDYGMATIEQLLRLRNGEDVEQKLSTKLLGRVIT